MRKAALETGSNAVVDSAPAGMEQRILAAVSAIRRVRDCHNIRVRYSGPVLFLDLHVLGAARPADSLRGARAHRNHRRRDPADRPARRCDGASRTLLRHLPPRGDVSRTIAASGNRVLPARFDNHAESGASAALHGPASPVLPLMRRRAVVVRKRRTPEYRRRVRLEFLQDHFDRLREGTAKLIDTARTKR